MGCVYAVADFSDGDLMRKSIKQWLKGKKQFTCNNKCGKDCCSELFLPLTVATKDEFEKTGVLTERKEYTDMRWLRLHSGIKVRDITTSHVSIQLEDGVPHEILFCPVNNNHYLHIESKCRMLMKNGRCRIYRKRPKICMVAKCPAFDPDAVLQWLGQNSIYKYYG